MVPGVPLTGILERDLDATLAQTRPLWDEMRGARMLLTGATGFVGTHLLESVRHARIRTGVDVRVIAPARAPERLHARLPWTTDAAWLEVVSGDVRTFAMPLGAVDLIVHSANTASPAEIAGDPRGIARMVVEGSSRVYALGSAAGARRMLQLSSGSVCGQHFTPAAPITEDDPGDPVGEGPAEQLARAKRDAERGLIVASGAANAPKVVIARGFALAGPWLPLEAAFAFGNFIGAALRGGPVTVSGDGTPVRSYLYSADMVAWLWTLLMKGTGGRAYNVGSSHIVTIGELAHRVAALLGGTVEIKGTPAMGAKAHYHVPDLGRVKQELGLEETVPLNEAIVRTAQWWTDRTRTQRPL